MEFNPKIDLGNVITFLVVAVGLAVQWGTNSTRLSAVEVQVQKGIETNQALNATLISLQIGIARTQAQMDEREKRFDAAVAAETFREDQRDLHGRK
jgi:hypothetical protein